MRWLSSLGRKCFPGRLDVDCCRVPKDIHAVLVGIRLCVEVLCQVTQCRLRRHYAGSLSLRTSSSHFSDIFPSIHMWICERSHGSTAILQLLRAHFLMTPPATQTILTHDVGGVEEGFIHRTPLPQCLLSVYSATEDGKSPPIARLDRHVSCSVANDQSKTSIHCQYPSSRHHRASADRTSCYQFAKHVSGR